MNWAFRSLPHGHRLVPWHAHVIACLAVVIGLPLAGAGLIFLAGGLIDMPGMPVEQLGVATFVGVMLLYSPVFTAIGMACAIPLAWLALRQGHAGWASAALSGAILGYVLYTLPGGTSGVIGAGFGTLIGLVYWGVLRLSSPAAFAVSR